MVDTANDHLIKWTDDEAHVHIPALAKAIKDNGRHVPSGMLTAEISRAMVSGRHLTRDDLDRLHGVAAWLQRTYATGIEESNEMHERTGS